MIHCVAPLLNFAGFVKVASVKLREFFVTASFVRENAKKQDFARCSLNNSLQRSANCLTERKFESRYLNNWYSSLECVGDKNISPTSMRLHKIDS